MPIHRRTVPMLFFALILLALLAVSVPLPASAQSPTPGNSGLLGAAAALQATCLNAPGVRLSYHRATGQVRFIGTQPGRSLAQPFALPPSASPEAAARAYLSRCGTLFGLQDQAAQLRLERSRSIDRGRAQVRFQQVHKGIPVFGGELITELETSGRIIDIAGELAPQLTIDTRATVTAAEAQQTAVAATAREYQLQPQDLTASQAELWIYDPRLVGPDVGPAALVWRMEVTPKQLAPIRELVLVNAQRGNVELSFNQVDTAKNRITYDMKNGTTPLPGTQVCTEANANCTNGADPHADYAHQYAGDTYDFYFNNLNRDSIDGAGMTIKSSVHYGSNYQNAFWNGQQMVYGDAQDYPKGDDVVGHELTHGVTQYTSNLFYYYQSGAINESLSDVFGEFVDLTNGRGTDDAAHKWLMGEDIEPGATGAIRSMKDPTLFGDPDKMSSPNYYSGTCGNAYSFCDNGGVHINSGVNNKAAYLMTDGDTFNGRTVAGLGIPKVARIYYEVETNFLTSGSDYADLYDALYQACLNLVGTSGIVAGDCDQVRNATDAVEMNKQPVAGYNPEAPVCDAGVPNNLFFDDLESGAGKWTFGALQGTSRWQLGSLYGDYAHSGAGFLYADDYPAAVSDSFAAMKTGVTLPANAFMHFAHAFGFDDGGPGKYYDGGVLEYSANGGAWTDAGSLIINNKYRGTINSNSSNPLSGRSGFVADSHGYISTRLDLSSLAGQTVRFRWRMGLDSSYFDWGWWLDDVRIYTCHVGPGAFGKVAPASDAAAQPSNPTLRWNPSDGATGYEYCYDDSNNNNCDSSWQSAGTNTSADLSGLSPNVTYFWQVRANDPTGSVEADTGRWWAFTTGPLIDDDEPQVQLNTWLGVADANASGGAYRTSKAANSTASFTFSGTAVTWLTLKGPDQGKAEMLIDGVSKRTVDNYKLAPAKYQAKWPITGLSAGSHTLTIKVLGQRNPASTGANIVVDGFVVGTTTTEESSPKATFNTWVGKTGAKASGGSYRLSGAANAAVTFKFSGTSVTWLTAKGPAYGKAKVLIDNVQVGPIFDLYNPTALWQQQMPFGGLSDGPHTLKIVVLGQKRAASTGTGVVVDAFTGALTVSAPSAADAAAATDE